MEGHASVDAILPPRKEKAKCHENGEVKTPRKPKWGSNVLGLPNPQVRYRMEAKNRASRTARGALPPPMRGGVKKAIFKELGDSTRGFCCSSPPSTLDADLEEAPFPTKSQPIATIWPKLDMPMWEE